MSDGNSPTRICPCGMDAAQLRIINKVCSTGKCIGVTCMRCKQVLFLGPADCIACEADARDKAVVTMPARVALLLVAGHLNHLHSADQEDGCCPVCCGCCWALKELLDAGQLDDLVRDYATDGWDCWDVDAGRVDRAWLERAWRLSSCHNH